MEKRKDKSRKKKEVQNEARKTENLYTQSRQKIGHRRKRMEAIYEVESEDKK